MARASEEDILRDAEEKARQVLTSAVKDAQEILGDAHSKAVALLTEQQEAAARLILRQRREAGERLGRNMRKAESLPDDKREQSLADSQRDAAELANAQWRAAELLVTAQRKAAADLREAVDVGVTDKLMAGQKEAAAIIAEALTRIARERTVGRDRAAGESGEP